MGNVPVCGLRMASLRPDMAVMMSMVTPMMVVVLAGPVSLSNVAVL